jgi:hypothetical protein
VTWLRLDVRFSFLGGREGLRTQPYPSRDIGAHGSGFNPQEKLAKLRRDAQVLMQVSFSFIVPRNGKEGIGKERKAQRYGRGLSRPSRAQMCVLPNMASLRQRNSDSGGGVHAKVTTRLYHRNVEAREYLHLDAFPIPQPITNRPCKHSNNHGYRDEIGCARSQEVNGAEGHAGQQLTNLAFRLGEPNQKLQKFGALDVSMCVSLVEKTRFELCYCPEARNAEPKPI